MLVLERWVNIITAKLGLECRLYKEWVLEAGSWMQNNSYSQHYALGAGPGASLATAGFRSLRAVCTVQTVFVPPDAVVNEMLGVVVQVHDRVTGKKTDLTIDEAISKAELRFEGRKGKESPVAFLKALRALAVAMARVRALTLRTSIRESLNRKR